MRHRSWDRSISVPQPVATSKQNHIFWKCLKDGFLASIAVTMISVVVKTNQEWRKKSSIKLWMGQLELVEFKKYHNFTNKDYVLRRILKQKSIYNFHQVRESLKINFKANFDIFARFSDFQFCCRLWIEFVALEARLVKITMKLVFSKFAKSLLRWIFEEYLDQK